MRFLKYTTTLSDRNKHHFVLNYTTKFTKYDFKKIVNKRGKSKLPTNRTQELGLTSCLTSTS